MSFKPEVTVDTSGKWYPNALRFATEQEAQAYVGDLANRWLSVRDTRVVPSEDDVCARWVNGKLQMWRPDPTDPAQIKGDWV